MLRQAIYRGLQGPGELVHRDQPRFEVKARLIVQSCSATSRVKSEVCGEEDIAREVARESGKARAGMSVQPSGG